MKFLFDKEKQNALNFDFITEIFIEEIFTEKYTHCVNINLIQSMLEGSITTFKIKDFETEESARNYLNDLAKDFNFLISCDGKIAVNPAVVRRFCINNFSVEAEFYDLICTTSVILKEFDSGNKEKDLEDAKNYLADLAKILNGGNL